MKAELKISRSLYETDFVVWAEQTAQLIRAGQFEGVDWENVAEEIERLGRSDKRELKNRLKVLLQHLLKWQYQPNRRCGSWSNTIDEQRDAIQDLLLDSPSLSPYLLEVLMECYQRGRRAANNETGLMITTFPETCPYSIAQILDEAFLPDEN
jgi:hypothetical protein